MSKKIFVSYARQDKDKVQAMIESLRNQESVGEEITEVMDSLKELSGGEEIRKNIRDNIQQADEVIVFWTPASANSSWVNYEAGMAEALGKSITVVQLGKSAPTLPANFRSFKVLSLKDASHYKKWGLELKKAKVKVESSE